MSIAWLYVNVVIDDKAIREFMLRDSLVNALIPV